MNRILRTCPFCMEEHVVSLTDDQFKRYRMWKDGGGRIQDLLSDLTPDDRESLKTGICERCWKRMEAGA